MANDLLLRLPHRLVTLSLPICLRVFFKYDRKLFSEVSRLIYDMVQSYYNEAANAAIETASVLTFQIIRRIFTIECPLPWNSPGRRL